MDAGFNQKLSLWGPNYQKKGMKNVFWSEFLGGGNYLRVSISGVGMSINLLLNTLYEILCMK